MRDAQVDGVSVHEGDIIGMVNDVMVAAGSDLKQVLHDTLEKMDVANREIVTLYYGAGVTMEDAQRTEQQITAWYPDLEIEVVDGGQPHYTYIISAE